MKKQIAAVFLGILFYTIAPFECAAVEIAELTELSLEELMEIKVTSVGKKAQNLSESAAAIFVITGEDIKRAGVTNVPDALKLVPGMHVGRIDANKWAVNSRGFNGRFASHLLVLIDGRSTYTPSFSGVYWEVNDVFLEDVERIEVIRGPGATLWGANAVNGVINIITKSSKDTQGGVIQAGTGNIEPLMAAMRYGGQAGNDTTWRIYAKQNNWGAFEDIPEGDAGDDWHMTRSGFRMDTRLDNRDSFTLQGDMYKGSIDQEVYLSTLTAPYMQEFSIETEVSGGNLLGRWKRTFSSASDLSFQAYVDTTRRHHDVYNSDQLTADFDFQHRFPLGRMHDIVWGLKYRYTEDEFSDTGLTDVTILDMDPGCTCDHFYSAFIQDELSFSDGRFRVTLGSKFENNSYTGFEIQPSISAIWILNRAHKVWGAVSRAVRTPSRSEQDANVSLRSADYGLGFPVQVRFTKNGEFVSEELLACEMGYRFSPNNTVSLDAAFFFNDYDHVRSAEPVTYSPPLFDLQFVNNAEIETYGMDLSLGYRLSKQVKWTVGYAFLEHRIKNLVIGGFPRHQASVRGQFSLTETIDADIWLRYVSSSSATHLTSESGLYPIDAYFTMDARLAWELKPGVELSIVGQNLLARSHLEGAQEFFAMPAEVPRSVYGMLTCTF